MRLEQAQALATDLMKMLAPFVDRIEVAGGVRRKKLSPHDIELVAIPRIRELRTGDMDLATGVERTILSNGLDWFMGQCFDHARTPVAGLLFKPAPKRKNGSRAPFSSRHFMFLYKDELVDMYVVLPPAQWGVIYTIRTGDAGYTHALVSKGWPKGLYFMDGAIYRVTRKKDGSVVQSQYMRPGEEMLFKDDINLELVPTPEEVDVFKALGVEYVPPELRVTTETTAEEWAEA